MKKTKTGHIMQAQGKTKMRALSLFKYCSEFQDGDCGMLNHVQGPLKAGPCVTDKDAYLSFCGEYRQKDQ